MADLRRHVLSLPFKPNVQSKLINCGLSFIEDFDDDNLNHDSLKKITHLSDEDINQVIQVIQRYRSSKKNGRKKLIQSYAKFESVSDILKKKLQQNANSSHLAVHHIVSLSEEVDKILNGGFKLNEITEIAGEAGMGKTQFCFQLCIDVQIPECVGGLGGEAVFLDVEGTFMPQRVSQIAKATIEHCENIAKISENNTYNKCSLTVEKCLSSIYLFRCIDSIKLLGATCQLKEFLLQHPKVKLLVIDSIAHSVRCCDDRRSGIKVLTNMTMMLREISVLFKVAIVLTNQVTSRPSAIDGISHTVPALGETWSHVASTKIMLLRRNGIRHVLLYKSPCAPRNVAQYQITNSGIRDNESSSIFQTDKCLDEFKENKSILHKEEKMKCSKNESITNELSQDTKEAVLMEWSNPMHYDSVEQFPEELISEKYLVQSQRFLNETFSTSSKDANFVPETGEIKTDLNIQNTDLKIVDSGKTKAATTGTCTAQNVDFQTNILSDDNDEEYFNSPPSPVIKSLSKKRKRD